MSSLRKRLIIISILLIATLLSLLTSNHVLNFNSNFKFKLPENSKLETKVNPLDNPIDFNSPLDTAYQQNNYDFLNQNPLKISEIKIPYKLFHLDLKGSPPKISYLKKLLKNLKSTGCNGILLEYEDMFPFSGNLRNISHRNAYSLEELKEFLMETVKYDFEIIPLVQTFGHLEFLLKYEEYVEFREVKKYPQEICPKNTKGVEIVENVVGQILDFHTSLKIPLNYVHIGMDEVFHLGLCKKCKNAQPKDLFTNHVKTMATYIKQKYKAIPIIWDDMLRKFYGDELAKTRLGEYVEIMVWDYTENVDHLVSNFLWPMYEKYFKHIWVASAFKGAFGENLFQVDTRRHFLNQVSWLQVLSREYPRMANFRGIAITGWSRYDHFSVLCELLPVAVPSLYGSFLILKSQSTLNSISKELSKLLNCPSELSDMSNNLQISLESCHWPGQDLYLQMNNLKYYEQSVYELIDSWRRNKGYLTYYNLKYNESSVWRLEEPKMQAGNYLHSLISFGEEIIVSISKYFPDFVGVEFKRQKVDSLVYLIKDFIKDIDTISNFSVFKRRPI